MLLPGLHEPRRPWPGSPRAPADDGPQRMQFVVERASSAAVVARRGRASARATPPALRTGAAISISAGIHPLARSAAVATLPAARRRLEPVGVRERADRKQAVAQVQQRRRAAALIARPACRWSGDLADRRERTARSRRTESRGSRAPAPCPAIRTDDRVVGRPSSADGCCRCGRRTAPTPRRLAAGSRTPARRVRRTHDEPRCVQHEAVAVPQHGAARQRRRELDAGVRRRRARVFSRSSQPSVIVSRAYDERRCRQRVGAATSRRDRQRLEHAATDRIGLDVRTGSSAAPAAARSAGSHVSSSPSARTS